jgi:hypothetical protein
MLKLARVKQGEAVSVYQGSDGAVYLLRPVDRQYAGRPKPPRYYLLRKDKAGKPEYLSGVFPTTTEGVFSLDLKDALGIKTMYLMKVEEQGKYIEIAPRRVPTGALS